MTIKEEEVPRVCVVLSYWTGHPKKNVVRALRSMRRKSPGHQFDLVVVCNGGDREPLADHYVPVAAKVINRVNSGYNLGAWEAGWRSAPDYDFYLFLQDECFVRRKGWLAAFIYRIQTDQGLGLLGESMMWDRLGWSFIEEDTLRSLGSRAMSVREIRTELARRGINEGTDGSHLQSLVWFVSREVLETVGGILSADSYLEAVACEVGFSKKVESEGYRIAQISRDPFRYVLHPQWTRKGRMITALRRARGRMKAAIKRAIASQ
jgi:hypothetical protein